MTAYYNENDSFAAAWLRELIKRNLIAPGEVDERDIRQVRADDLRGFTQCHFFAGIGVWSYALRQAGWPDDQRVWTGSCPCQPFSVSGKRAGASDERHLWPVWFPLIRESRPERVFGEQVASDDGLAWLDLVSADLEGQDYTLGAVDTPACGFGAPHRRQRLYWVAQSKCDGRRSRSTPTTRYQGRTALTHDGSDPSTLAQSERVRLGGRRLDYDGRTEDARRDSPERSDHRQPVEARGSVECLADATSRHSSDGELQRSGQHGQFAQDGGTLRLADSQHSEWRTEREINQDAHGRDGLGRSRENGNLGDTESGRCGERGNASQLRHGGHDHGAGFTGNVAESDKSRLEIGERCTERQATRLPVERPDSTNGYWRDAEWLWCRDQKYRPTQSVTQQMADGSSESLGRVCEADRKKIAEEVNEAAQRYKTDTSEAVLDLWTALSEAALRQWQDRGLRAVHEAPVLLAFLRELTEQGWPFAQGVSRESQEIAEEIMRGLRQQKSPARSSPGRRLDEQQTGQRSDLVHFLSSILARHASEAWSETFNANARDAFPLATGERNRVGRLRGYGNALVAEQAKAFIEAYLGIVACHERTGS